MIRSVGKACYGSFFKAVFWSNINLTPYNRLNAVFLCLQKKIHGAKHIAVICHGNCRHFILFRSLKKLFKSQGSIKQTELCVKV